MSDPVELSASEAAARIAVGKLTSEALVEAYLSRIKAREPEIGAWAYIDPDQALAEARARDKQDPLGPLHGVPIGVKDIIATARLPTEYGSPIYGGNQAGFDGPCVALSRAAGAIVMGKTVTTEFALRHPAATRNPRNPAYTPGGSSSGSAAAVADGMVALAFGTQTLGSVIRPAAYCGIVGFKPSHGTISRAGVKPLSDALDTIGVFARTVEDAALFAGTLGDRPLPDFSEGAGAAPRIGFCRTAQWPEADDATQSALEDAVVCLDKAGARIAALDLPPSFDSLAAAVTICNYDCYRSLAHERLTAPDLISPWLSDMLEGAAAIDRPAYEAALTLGAMCRRQIDGIFREVDVILAPSAPSAAPAGLESTGNPIFSQMWTLLHVPCVTLPVFTGPGGLPIGAQVIGPRNGDTRLLMAAEWVRRALG